MPFKDPETRKTRQRAYGKKWYAANKTQQIAKTRLRQAEGMAAWAAFRATHRCVRCGVGHPSMIDFHHYVKTNKQRISALLKDGKFAAARIEAESKCIPLCANCHRLIHWSERQGPRTKGHEP